MKDKINENVTRIAELGRYIEYKVNKNGGEGDIVALQIYRQLIGGGDELSENELLVLGDYARELNAVVAATGLSGAFRAGI